MAAAASRQVVFTSGATEALTGVLLCYVGLGDRQGKKIVTSTVEHDAVLATSRYICERAAVSLEVLPVNRAGHVSLAQLGAAVEASPGALVAIMAANNETGTLTRVRPLADVVHAANGLLLSDTTQSFGRVSVDLEGEGIDFATISAHKMHGPKGSGALLVRTLESLNRLDRLLFGSGQQSYIRAGTPNVPGIVGFGEACRIAKLEMAEESQRVGRLRDKLESALQAQLRDIWINGDTDNRLPNTSNIGFRGVDARTLIRDMRDIAVSTRSACSSGNSGPSHVLKAIGLSDEDAYSCIRFSLGRFTTEEEIDYAINKVITSVHKLRRNKSVRI